MYSTASQQLGKSIIQDRRIVFPYLLCHLCQIFNEFNARKPEEKNVFKGVTNNQLFMAIVGATTVLQVTCYQNAFSFAWFDERQLSSINTLCQILMIEFLGKFFDTAKLNWRLWLLSVAIGAVRYACMLLLCSVKIPAACFPNNL